MTKYGFLLLALLAFLSMSFAQGDQNVPGTNQHDESWDIPGNHYPTIQEQNAQASRDGEFLDVVSKSPSVGQGCEFDGVQSVFGGRSAQTWDKNQKATEILGNRTALHRLDDVLRRLENGKLAKADRKIAEALKKDPDSALAWSLRGEILWRQGNVAEAKAAFDQATTFDSQLIFPAIGKAQIAAREGEWKLARDLSGEAFPVLLGRLRRRWLHVCTAPASYQKFVTDQMLQALKINQEAFAHTQSARTP